MPEHVYNYRTGKVEPKPEGWPRLYPGHRTDARDYPRSLSPVPGAETRYDDDGHEILDVMTCGTCGRSWNDAAVSAWTPAPSGRCPFEYDHEYDEN